MTHGFAIRSVLPADRQAWSVLWEGYNEFYGRRGATALAPQVTQTLWERLLDPTEPVHAQVSVHAGCVVGLAHFVLHRSTNRIEPVCYLQDLFTAPQMRERGVARALIEDVHLRAIERGAKRLYWHTRSDNSVARALYERVARHDGFIVYTREAPVGGAEP